MQRVLGGMLTPKSDAKVGIKKKSLEFRDSFGTDGTISVLSVLIRYKIGTKSVQNRYYTLVLL
jgi:hypothetical protein